MCFACLVGTFPGAVARPAVTAISDRVGRRFLRLNEHYAEPGAGANRAGPSGFALEFLVGSHQFSGRSASSFGGYLSMSPILQSSPWVRYPAAVVVTFAASIAIEVIFVTGSLARRSCAPARA